MKPPEERYYLGEVLSEGGRTYYLNGPTGTIATVYNEEIATRILKLLNTMGDADEDSGRGVPRAAKKENRIKKGTKKDAHPMRERKS